MLIHRPTISYDDHYHAAGAYVPWPSSTDDNEKPSHCRLEEPIIQVIDDSNIVTLNNVNCYVLNSSNLWIADIDIRNGGHEIKGLPTLSQIIAALLKASKRESVGFHLYETKGGYRAICATMPMTVNQKSIATLEAVLSDPRYVRLCAVTQTYRARLSAKPKGHEMPLHAAVCRYVETIGKDTIHPTLQAVIKHHDVATKARSGVKALV